MTRPDEAPGPGCRQRTACCPAVADDLVSEHVQVVPGGVECHLRPGQQGAGRFPSMVAALKARSSAEVPQGIGGSMSSTVRLKPKWMS